MSEWEAWVRKTTAGATSREVGERIGHSHSTALRWMHAGVTPQIVIQFALAYDADVLEALVAAGWLDADDVAHLNLNGALKSLSTVKLAAEVYARAAEAAKRHAPFNGN